MKFCSQCGSGSIVWQVPDGDNRPRHVCGECNEIHYQNPKLGFYFMKLIVSRLMADVQRHKAAAQAA
mgnify:CR=1 FL=1